MRVRLDIAYDGTHFAGWAIQPGLRTVSSTLESALATVLRLPEPPRLVVAGRTDAGVHATAQVAHVDLEAITHTTDLDRLIRRLASALSRDSDVVIHRISLAPEGFDARFSPIARCYRYAISDRLETRNPLNRHTTVWIRHRLDLNLLREAADCLVGLRDFGAFCKPRAGATTIRELQQFTWDVDDSGVLVADLQADAFCHSMVRSLVGGTVAVASGRLSIDDLTHIRERAVRTSSIKVMPAHGLTLTNVIYPADDQLASRAEATRARRSDVCLDWRP